LESIILILESKITKRYLRLKLIVQMQNIDVEIKSKATNIINISLCYHVHMIDKHSKIQIDILPLHAYIRGLYARVDPSAPVLVLVALSVYCTYSRPSVSFFNSKSPHIIWLCSWHPRSPKCKVVLSHMELISACGVPMVEE
jgi:hypothetical protein